MPGLGRNMGVEAAKDREQSTLDLSNPLQRIDHPRSDPAVLQTGRIDADSGLELRSEPSAESQMSADAESNSTKTVGIDTAISS